MRRSGVCSRSRRTGRIRRRAARVRERHLQTRNDYLLQTERGFGSPSGKANCAASASPRLACDRVARARRRIDSGLVLDPTAYTWCAPETARGRHLPVGIDSQSRRALIGSCARVLAQDPMSRSCRSAIELAKVADCKPRHTHSNGAAVTRLARVAGSTSVRSALQCLQRRPIATSSSVRHAASASVARSHHRCGWNAILCHALTSVPKAAQCGLARARHNVIVRAAAPGSASRRPSVRGAASAERRMRCPRASRPS